MAGGSQYVSKLNEYSQKLGVKPPEYEDLGSRGPDHMKQFTQRVRFNGKVYPEGVGNTKKVAKHNAAKNAFEILMGRTEESLAAPKAAEPAGLDENHEETELCNKTSELSVSKEDTSFTKKVDYVSIVNKYCQTKNLFHNYMEVDREGPSHNFQFFYRLEINKRQYPVGKGKNIKEAKQMAAQLGWSALQEQSDWDSKVSVGSAVFQDETSEITSTAATESSLPESEFSAQNTQSSTSDWIQFRDSSKPSSVQESSSDQDTGKRKDLDKNSGNGLTAALQLSRFNSDFDFVERLGKGSYGFVYKARHKILDQYRAIKEVQTREIDKSLQEVKILADLNHKNIVRYYNCWLQDTGYISVVKSNAKFLFIEMELCDGGTLRRWICNKNRESSESSREKQSLALAQQILSGVEYIHTKKLIHRDLKPENILFGRDGHVRIGDFGLATVDNDEEIVERTQDAGTRNYMAPEQVGVNYDRKVDVFALGLIFFELFWRIATGHERGAIWTDIRHQNLPNEFTGTYPIESHIIKTMLSKKPEARPEASALKNELKKWTRTPRGNTDHGNQTV